MLFLLLAIAHTGIDRDHICHRNVSNIPAALLAAFHGYPVKLKFQIVVYGVDHISIVCSGLNISIRTIRKLYNHLREMIPGSDSRNNKGLLAGIQFFNTNNVRGIYFRRSKSRTAILLFLGIKPKILQGFGGNVQVSGSLKMQSKIL